jgi:GntR family transcriptional regulator
MAESSFKPNAVDRDSAVPIYSQVEALILEPIHNGQLKPGAKAPSEREIAETLGISRMTARAAVSNLVQSGYLYSVPGKGTFVANPKLPQSLANLTSFTEDMERRGMRPGARLLALDLTRTAPLEARELLGTETDDELVRVARLRLADGEPMCIESSFLSKARCLWVLGEDLETGSLYRLLEARGLQLQIADERLEATALASEQAQLLGVQPGSPGLQVTRITYSEGKYPIEYVRSLYRGDRYEFRTRLSRQHKEGA